MPLPSPLFRAPDPKALRAMVDIETMGTWANAPILSIGACLWTVADGVLSAPSSKMRWEQTSFHVKLPWALDNGVVDLPTVEWWLQQTDEARGRLLSGPRTDTVSGGLVAFWDWLDRVRPVEIWANGPEFDVSVLKEAFRCHTKMEIANGASVPWEFWRTRDFRTLRALMPEEMVSEATDARGKAHDALSDAVFQAGLAARFLRTLGPAEETP